MFSGLMNMTIYSSNFKKNMDLGVTRVSFFKASVIVLRLYVNNEYTNGCVMCDLCRRLNNWGLMRIPNISSIHDYMHGLNYVA